MRYIYIKLFLFCFFLSPSCYGTSSPWVKAEVNEVNILDLREHLLCIIYLFIAQRDFTGKISRG